MKKSIDKSTGELALFRSPFWRERVQFVPVGDSMTHQSHAEACDVNAIIRRYDRTGVLPPATREAQYGDVTGLQGDLTERYVDAQATTAAAASFLQSKAEEQQKLPLQSPLDSAQPTEPPAAT